MLSGCSDPVDETVISGNWVVAGDTCSGSGAKVLKYQDGNLVGNNSGVIEPFFKIHSARRDGVDVRIEFQPVLARAPAEPIGIVFRVDGDKLVGQRTFDGRDFSGNKEFVDGLTWTRCNPV